MDKMDYDIKVFKVMAYIRDDIKNILDKLEKRREKDEPVQITASIVISICFSLISRIPEGLWMEMMELLIQYLHIEYKKREEE